MDVDRYLHAHLFLVLSDKKQLFKYSFDVTTPEYEILEVLEEINEHVDNGQHPLGCSCNSYYT